MVAAWTKKMDMTGFLTSVPNKRVHIASTKLHKHKEFQSIGNACNDLILRGGATKTMVQRLKDQMMADAQ